MTFLNPLILNLSFRPNKGNILSFSQTTHSLAHPGITHTASDTLLPEHCVCFTNHAFTFIISILKLPLILRDAYSSLPGCSPLNSLQEPRVFYIVAIFCRMSSVELLNFGTVFIKVIKISVLGPSLTVSVLVYEVVDRKTLLFSLST